MGEDTAGNTHFAELLAEVSPASPYGRKVKSRVKPFLPGDEKALVYEYRAVSSLAGAWDSQPDTFSRLLSHLSTSKDALHAVSLLREGRSLSPTEMFLLAHLALTANKVLAVMTAAADVPWPERAVPPRLHDIEKRLFPAVSGQPVFYVADTYSANLAKARAERKSKEKAWRDEMVSEAETVEKVLGRKIGLREEIAIKKSAPEDVEKARLMPELAEVRESLTYVHFKLKAARAAVRLERDIHRLRQKETSLEEQVLEELSRELRPRAEQLEGAAWALGELDYLLCKASLARKWKAVVPEVLDGPGSGLRIVDGVHPIVRREVQSRGGIFQPVTLNFDPGVNVVTGPNMGGKTVSLSTAGLLVALAQHGFLTPCGKMSFALYDFIYFQPQTQGKPGLSSFASEIISLKAPLSKRDLRGLILLDEVGRGTNPSQGLALYAAVLQHLRETHSRCPTIVAATHYHGLASLIEAPHWQVAGLQSSGQDLPNGAADIEWLYRNMVYRLQRVGPEAPTPQDALLVARLLGLDASIVKKAELALKGGKAQKHA